MSGSSGLIRYIARRMLPTAGSGADPATAPEARPEGALVWLHVGEGSRPAAVYELGQRLSGARPKLGVLVTTAQANAPPVPAPMLSAANPGDSASETRAFLTRWRPDVAVLTGLVAQPNALLDLGAAGVPVCLADAVVPAKAFRSLRWAPGVRRAIFEHVGAVITKHADEAEAFCRLGLPADRVEAVGALEEGAAPLPANDAELADLSELFTGRPKWLAVGVTPDEEDAVVGAHRQACQLAHRLLLVLVPADPDRGPALARRFEDTGWRVALRSDGDEPDTDCQVYVADTEGENGLWYRLCPLTFLGGSLGEGGAGLDPCGPATLGSAILSGPANAAYRWRLSRFLAAGAARTVGSERALGDAVAELLAPDRAAEMARRAWEVTSEGAAATDRVIDFVTAALDDKGLA